jgi:predicted phage-related endonuclease
MLSPDRKTVFTGTDIPILFGAVPKEWGTPASVIRSKLGLEPEKPMNPTLMSGHLLEPVVATLFSMKHPELELSEPGFFKKNELFLGGSPDRMIRLNEPDHFWFAGLEIKTTQSYEGWGDPSQGNYSIPDRVLLQAMTYMIVTDIKEWFIAVLIRGFDYREYLIQYDEELAERIIMKALHYKIQYWDKEIIPPDEMVTESPIQPDDGTSIESDDNLKNILFEYDKVIKQEEAVKIKKDALRDSIKSFMGNAKKIIDPNWNISYGMRKGTIKTDYEKVTKVLMGHVDEEFYKKLISAHTTIGTPSRVMTLTKKGNNND